ncbi:hypothetical protein BD413DRAFT_595716 [Trametes elegans]|nr:hypothetical protein BD413DRAFT_595716 [Trametes elegans]
MSTSGCVEAWMRGGAGTTACGSTRARTRRGRPARAVLRFLPGFAEHVGRGEGAHGLLSKSGPTVFAYDRRGFGQARRRRGTRAAAPSGARAGARSLRTSGGGGWGIWRRRTPRSRCLRWGCPLDGACSAFGRRALRGGGCLTKWAHAMRRAVRCC